MEYRASIAEALGADGRYGGTVPGVQIPGLQSSSTSPGLLYKVSRPGRAKRRRRCRTRTTRGGLSAQRYNPRRPTSYTKENAE